MGQPDYTMSTSMTFRSQFLSAGINITPYLSRYLVTLLVQCGGIRDNSCPWRACRDFYHRQSTNALVNADTAIPHLEPKPEASSS
jgi:hypothetical protein